MNETDQGSKIKRNGKSKKSPELQYAYQHVPRTSCTRGGHDAVTDGSMSVCALARATAGGKFRSLSHRTA
jgi:hypothetical protein